MDFEKNCCVIGLHKIFANKQSYLKQKLEQEIIRALNDGHRTFIAEYVPNTEPFFRYVNERGKEYPNIFLEAVISQNCELLDHDLLSMCDGIKVLHGNFQQGSQISVTRYLIRQSGRVIIIFDESPDHNTAYAIDYAGIIYRDLRVIEI